METKGILSPELKDDNGEYQTFEIWTGKLSIADLPSFNAENYRIKP